MEVCDYCRFRHSWDCDDGYPHPKRGCDSFELDGSTIDSELAKNIIFLMKKENINKEDYHNGWI